MHVLRQGRSQWTQQASYHDVVQPLTNHLDSGFRKCLFNTIPFQVCFHILHIVYLGLRGYQAFPSGWGRFNLKVLRLTTVSAVNFWPRAKKNRNNLDNISDWLRLETPTKALLQLTWKPREYASNTQYTDAISWWLNENEQTNLWSIWDGVSRFNSFCDKEDTVLWNRRKN